MSVRALPRPVHGGKTFRDVLRERLISVRTMDPRLRLFVGAAVAQLLVAAIMVALRGANMPRILGDVTDGQESNVPVATFVVATSFVVIAWTFVLAGALHAHWAVRVLAVGLFSWSLLLERDVPAETTWGALAAAVLLGLIVAITLLTIVRDRKAKEPSPRLLAARVALLLPLVAGL